MVTKELLFVIGCELNYEIAFTKGITPEKVVKDNKEDLFIEGVNVIDYLKQHFPEVYTFIKPALKGAML